MAHNPAIWFEIYVQDIPRAKSFYESVFQVTLEKLDSPGFEMWAFPMVMNEPGASGALVKIPGVASGGNSTLIYLHCEDCAVEAERAASLGGAVKREKTPIGKYGYISLIVDTEGNTIGLHSMK